MDANNSWRCHFKYLQNEFPPSVSPPSIILPLSSLVWTRLGQPFQLILICVFLFLLNVTFYSERDIKCGAFIRSAGLKIFCFKIEIFSVLFLKIKIFFPSLPHDCPGRTRREVNCLFIYLPITK